MKTVIHHDGTFGYKGELYRCARQGPYGSGDNAYEVYRVRDGRTIDDGIFYSLSEIRVWVNKAREYGWDLIEETTN